MCRPQNSFAVDRFYFITPIWLQNHLAVKQEFDARSQTGLVAAKSVCGWQIHKTRLILGLENTDLSPKELHILLISMCFTKMLHNRVVQHKRMFLSGGILNLKLAHIFSSSGCILIGTTQQILINDS